MTTTIPLSAADSASDPRSALSDALSTLNDIILGKPAQIELAVACLLAGGHLLIEDVPGVGKTTMARALARVLGLDFMRIQFTSDLLPSDVTGISIFDKQDGRFHFHPGPVFTQMLLADEINRATPKAQSALLEAMQENQVTVDGTRHPLKQPFFVVATQNPGDQIGTFELPESQLDRFLMRIHLGYPDRQSERKLLTGANRARSLDDVSAVITPAQIMALRQTLDQVALSEPLLDYLQALITHTRNAPEFSAGLSPRAGIALSAAARAYAIIKGRKAVYPDDLQTVFPAVAGHRLAVARDISVSAASELARKVLDAVAIP